MITKRDILFILSLTLGIVLATVVLTTNCSGQEVAGGPIRDGIEKRINERFATNEAVMKAERVAMEGLLSNWRGDLKAAAEQRKRDRQLDWELRKKSRDEDNAAFERRWTPIQNLIERGEGVVESLSSLAASIAGLTLQVAIYVFIAVVSAGLLLTLINRLWSRLLSWVGL